MAAYSHQTVRTKILSPYIKNFPDISGVITFINLSSLSNCSILNRVENNIVSIDIRGAGVQPPLFLMGVIDSIGQICTWVAEDVYSEPTVTTPPFSGEIREKMIISELR